MKRKYVSWAVLIVLAAAAAVVFSAQAADTQGRSLPTFEVDHAWPKVPPQW